MTVYIVRWTPRASSYPYLQVFATEELAEASKWYGDDDPRNYSKYIEKQEVIGLNNENTDNLKENKMKRSELKQLIKEEILKEMAVTEMAKLKSAGGELTDLGKMIKRIVSANKGKSVSDISKQVKKNDNVKKWLADNPDQDLHANQLQRFIKVQIGDLELGKRGRKKKEDDKE